MELWSVILEFPEYSVSSLGAVRRDSTGRLLRFKVNQYGVVYVGLMRAHEQFQRGVALLVAENFLPVPHEAHLNTPINKNGDRWDNRVENLAWRSRTYAVQYNRQFRNRYDYPIVYPVYDVETGEVFANSWEAAIYNGLLERDVVLSILNAVPTAITYQQFDLEN